MNKKNLFSIVFFLCLFMSKAQVHTSYLWHLHQPTYWVDVSKINQNRYQTIKESQDLKASDQKLKIRL